MFGLIRNLIGRPKKDDDKNFSFIPQVDNDGSIVVEQSASTLAAFGTTYITLDGKFSNEAELIRTYRYMSIQAECAKAINEIVNDAIVHEEGKSPVEINLNETSLSESTKKKIEEEFETILRLLNFKLDGQNIFRRFFVDGRLFYHKIVDPDKKKEGIKELRYIEPFQIRKIRIVKRETDPETGIEIFQTVGTRYVYNQMGIYGFQNSRHDDIFAPSGRGIEIDEEDICYAHSGLIDEKAKIVISPLHKTIRPFNQLREMEDSLVIYRIARAPERRVFYLDVGNMRDADIEQYVKKQMQQYRNSITYDSESGEISTGARHMAMLEDFWIPRREGTNATEIETLPGGENLDQIADVEYFQKKFYESLDVPLTRLDPERGFTLGRVSEISRDEVNFSRYISRLRENFAHQFFSNHLRTQCLLKGIVSKEDWDEIEQDIIYDFRTDSHFSEMKHSEILRERISLLRDADDAAEKGYLSRTYIAKNVLRLTDDEIEEIKKEIEKEKSEQKDDEEEDDQKGSFFGGFDREEDSTPEEEE